MASFSKFGSTEFMEEFSSVCLASLGLGVSFSLRPNTRYMACCPKYVCNLARKFANRSATIQTICHHLPSGEKQKEPFQPLPKRAGLKILFWKGIPLRQTQIRNRLRSRLLVEVLRAPALSALQVHSSCEGSGGHPKGI